MITWVEGYYYLRTDFVIHVLGLHTFTPIIMFLVSCQRVNLISELLSNYKHVFNECF